LRDAKSPSDPTCTTCVNALIGNSGLVILVGFENVGGAVSTCRPPLVSTVVARSRGAGVSPSPHAATNKAAAIAELIKVVRMPGTMAEYD